jgi:hypothetical protein
VAVTVNFAAGQLPNDHWNAGADGMTIENSKYYLMILKSEASQG